MTDILRTSNNLVQEIIEAVREPKNLLLEEAGFSLFRLPSANKRNLLYVVKPEDKNANMTDFLAKANVFLSSDKNGSVNSARQNKRQELSTVTRLLLAPNLASQSLGNLIFMQEVINPDGEKLSVFLWGSTVF